MSKIRAKYGIESDALPSNINQEKICEIIYQEYLAYGLSTKRVNKKALNPWYRKAHNVIKNAVEGAPEFRRVVWVKSPLAGCYLYSTYENISARAMLSVAQKLIKENNITNIKFSDLVSTPINIDFGRCFRACSMGGWESYWVGHFTFGEVVNNNYPEDVSKRLEIMRRLCDGHIWWPVPGYVIASERPTEIHRDDQNRLHNLTGPALAYEDGFRFYYVDGIHVPENIIENPASITISQIKSEGNAAVKRVIVQQYGLRRYLKDVGANLLDKRPNEQLYHDITEDRKFLLCSDGSTGAVYVIQVPNEVKTCVEAQNALAGDDLKYELTRS